jgi:hypothetical protein
VTPYEYEELQCCSVEKVEKGKQKRKEEERGRN